MTKNILFIITMTLTIKLGFSQAITELNSSISGVLYGETKWIDVNNDNVYEFIVAGNADYGQYTALGTYTEGEFTLESSNTFTQIGDASIDVADFNNDNYMDFIITGTDGSNNKTLIYLNDGSGQFTEQTTNMIGVTYGKVRVADLNNDNKPDVVITGMDNSYTYNAKLYFQNDEGDFIESTTSLMANYFGDITFIDVNNDNQLDLIITGFDLNYEPNSKLYINNDGILTENTQQSIAPFYFTGTAVGDIDNDGDEDFVVSGSNSSYNEETAIYLNDGSGNFTNSVAVSDSLDQVYFGDLNLVDFNKDNYLDIFSTGQDSNGDYISKLYINDGNNNFSLNTTISNSIIGVAISSSDWKDFDNDGDEDLVVVGYGNDGSEVASVYRNETVTLSTEKYSIEKIAVYPNPAKDFIHIKSKSPIASMKIYSMLGSKVLLNLNTNTNILDISQLSNGLYLLSIEDLKGKKQVIKFAKE